MINKFQCQSFNTYILFVGSLLKVDIAVLIGFLKKALFLMSSPSIVFTPKQENYVVFL